VSYHLGQPGKLREGIANGAILTLTYVGLALVLVLAGFAVISRAATGTIYSPSVAGVGVDEGKSALCC